jgi:hypothetical protein
MDHALSLIMLAGFIWAVTYPLPKASRERDGFGVTCSLLMALVALVGWLLVGTGVRA